MFKWVQSQNGGPTKLAEYIPEADAWRIHGRPELISRERFSGNYKIVEDRKTQAAP